MIPKPTAGERCRAWDLALSLLENRVSWVEAQEDPVARHFYYVVLPHLRDAIAKAHAVEARGELVRKP